MTRHLFKLAMGGLALCCAGCVVAPYPGAVYSPAEQACRQVVQPMSANGTTVPGYGMQCMKPDGTWDVVGPLSASPPTQPLAGAAVTPIDPPGAIYPGPYYDYPGYYGPGFAFDFGGGIFDGGGWGNRGGGGGRFGDYGGGFRGGGGGRGMR
jgi:hypothetical protein